MNPQIKKVITLIILIILLIAVLSISQSLKKVDDGQKNLMENNSDIIVSESIMNTPQPNDSDNFWASMYRQDPVTKKIYFVVSRKNNELKEIKNADVNSFKVLWSGDGKKFSYAMDIKGIYCNDKISRKFDPKTFTPPALNDSYARDAKNIYFDCNVVAGADSRDFTEISDARSWFNGQSFFYGIDGRNIYVNGVALKGVDPKTFIIGSSGYSYDVNNLYFLNNKIGDSEFELSDTSTGKISLINQPSLAIFQGLNEGGILNILNDNLNKIEEKILVYKGDMYFADSIGKLSTYNISQNKVSRFDINGIESVEPDKAPNIVDFFLNKENIYILYGNNCNEYRAKCDLELITYNTVTNDTKILASHIELREIKGIDEKENSIYLEYSNGDAGCFWTSTYVLSLVDGKLLRKFDMNGCSEWDGDGNSDNTEIDNMVADYSEKVKTVSGNKKLSDFVYIEKGKIIPPPDAVGHERGNVVYVME